MSSPVAEYMNASESNIQCNQNVVKREPSLPEQYILPDQLCGLEMDIKGEPETFLTETGSLVVSDVDGGRENCEVTMENSTVVPGSPRPLSSSSSTANGGLSTSSLASSSEKKHRQGVVDLSSASEQTVLLAENLLGDNQSVVKREPETFSTEMECLLDSKEEMCVADMIWEDAEVSTGAVTDFTFTPSAGESLEQDIPDPDIENSREKCEVLTKTQVVVKSPRPIFSSCSSANTVLNTSMPLPDIKEESGLSVIGLSFVSEESVLSPENFIAANQSDVRSDSEIFPSSGTNLVNLEEKINVEVITIVKKEKEDISSVTGEICDFQDANQCPGTQYSAAAQHLNVVLRGAFRDQVLTECVSKKFYHKVLSTQLPPNILMSCCEGRSETKSSQNVFRKNSTTKLWSIVTSNEIRNNLILFLKHSPRNTKGNDFRKSLLPRQNNGTRQNNAEEENLHQSCCLRVNSLK